MNIAYIPVRGGSKSIPMKNIKPIAGMPLVYWVIKAAVECNIIDHIYVSTDSVEIRKTVEGFLFERVTVVQRSDDSATDTVSTEFGMLEFAQNKDFKNIALIQATSPLLSALDLENGFTLQMRKGVDSVLSVVKQRRFIWSDTENGYAAPVNYNYTNRPLRQNFGGVLVENGAFYITSRNNLLKSRCRLSGNIKTIEMAPESYIELDEPSDWAIVEGLLRCKNLNSNPHKIPIIKMFLTDCDGTLTDAGMYYSCNGEELKKFNTRDGAGLRMLKEAGIITGIITSETSEIVQKRAQKLQIDELMMGIRDKSAAISYLCDKYNINKKHIAYIGDDVNDIEAIKSVGLGICVGDGSTEAKAVSGMITRSKGGRGAVREAIDLILSRK